MLGRQTAKERVSSFLLHIAERSDAEEGLAFELPMSRQDMADYLGLALETVSRVLSRFQDEKLVVFSSCRDFRIIKRSRLKRLAST